jgi:hypothetical protein
MPENSPQINTLPEPLERVKKLLDLRKGDIIDCQKALAMIDQTLTCAYRDCQEKGFGNEADEMLNGLSSPLTVNQFST